MVVCTNRKAKICILAEYHPTNLTALSFLAAHMIKKEIERLGSELIEKLYSSGEVDSILRSLEKEVDEMVECINMLLCAHEIREKEVEYLNEIARLPNKKIVVYLEGNRDANASRPEIVELAREKNLKLVYLDEGNRRYENFVDENGRILKHVHEIQVGREDFWVNKIEETIADADYAVVIVGRNHVRNYKDNIRKTYKRISPKRKSVGYFDERLRERGYEVEVFRITCKWQKLKYFTTI